MPRLADLYAALPAITGKIELEYEGELIGGAVIARELIRRAADATLAEREPRLDVDEIVMYFDTGSALQVSDDASAKATHEGFATVPGLIDLVKASELPTGKDFELVASCELVLEALWRGAKISRSEGGSYGRSVRRQGGLRRNIQSAKSSIAAAQAPMARAAPNHLASAPPRKLPSGEPPMYTIT